MIKEESFYTCRFQYRLTFFQLPDYISILDSFTETEKERINSMRGKKTPSRNRKSVNVVQPRFAIEPRLKAAAVFPLACSISLPLCLPSHGILFFLFLCRAVWTATTSSWNCIIDTAKFTSVYIWHAIRRCERGCALFSRTSRRNRIDSEFFLRWRYTLSSRKDTFTLQFFSRRGIHSNTANLHAIYEFRTFANVWRTRKCLILYPPSTIISRNEPIFDVPFLFHACINKRNT